MPESDESDMESLTFGLSIYSLRLSVRNTIYSYENELIGRKLDSFFCLFVLFFKSSFVPGSVLLFFKSISALPHGEEVGSGSAQCLPMGARPMRCMGFGGALGRAGMGLGAL